MRADILTKMFADSARWEASCWLVNVFHPDRLVEIIELRGQAPPQLGECISRGTWTIQPDGSGCWSRLDKSARFRTTAQSVPSPSEVTRRVIIDLATGKTLQETDGFAKRGSVRVDSA